MIGQVVSIQPGPSLFGKVSLPRAFSKVQMKETLLISH